MPRAAGRYEVLFLYFALSVFRFLDGTVIEEGVEGLWERFVRSLPEAEAARLSDFSRKFYAVPHAMKDYREFDEILDTIVQSLVRQNRMRRSVWARRSTRTVRFTVAPRGGPRPDAPPKLPGHRSERLPPPPRAARTA
jgi:hypothetical protein